jgi:hypothetical protein
MRRLLKINNGFSENSEQQHWSSEEKGRFPNNQQQFGARGSVVG